MGVVSSMSKGQHGISFFCLVWRWIFLFEFNFIPYKNVQTCILLKYFFHINTCEFFLCKTTRTFLLFWQTIVTTTTLNGQKQVLTADKGDKYQVDLLSTADVYKAPTAEEAANTDFAAIFSSQQVRHAFKVLCDFIILRQVKNNL